MRFPSKLPLRRCRLDHYPPRVLRRVTEAGIHVRATVDAGPSSMTSWWTSGFEDSEFWWIKRGRGKAYHLVEVQALSELSLSVHCRVVGDQDMVCEYGFFVVY